MESRTRLKEAGRQLRKTIGLSEEGHEDLAPGYQNLIEELSFGVFWSRKGLETTDRMITTLAVLGALERHHMLASYVHAAIEFGLSPRTVQEVFIHIGLYTGFPAAESALRIALQVFDERGIQVESPQVGEESLDELDEMGRTLMQKLHSTRSEQGYASAGHPTAVDLYNIAIQYAYGAVWHRPGLEIRQRVICALAAFTALEYHSQLSKFIRSALELDFSREEIVEILMQTVPYSGFPRAFNALVVAGDAMS